MKEKFTNWLISLISRWLLKQNSDPASYLCDFNLICKNIRPGDVLLVEGKTRASKIIQQVTQSTWSHAALYIGQITDVNDNLLRDTVKRYTDTSSACHIIVESEVGLGTIISSLDKYKDDHIRILRPRSLTKKDTQLVIKYAIGRLGKKYNLRHLLDLARFLFPWGLWPRKWRSSLFQHNALQPTQDICSSMIADAFQSVNYPILPLVRLDHESQFELIKRNPKLFTPSDFDYSPYFDVIKYPIFTLENEGDYHHLPWREGILSDDQKSPVYIATASEDMKERMVKFFSSKKYAVVGASKNKDKFGNKVLRCFLQNDKIVYPVNPKEKIIENQSCISQIADLPNDVKSISIVTAPSVTTHIVEEAIAKGIQNIWIQPGAESKQAVYNCSQNGINVIHGGPCILAELGFRE